MASKSVHTWTWMFATNTHNDSRAVQELTSQVTTTFEGNLQNLAPCIGQPLQLQAPACAKADSGTLTLAGSHRRTHNWLTSFALSDFMPVGPRRLQVIKKNL